MDGPSSARETMSDKLLNGQSLKILGSELNKNHQNESKMMLQLALAKRGCFFFCFLRYFAESIQGAFQKTGVKAEAIDRIYVT